MKLLCKYRNARANIGGYGVLARAPRTENRQ